MAGVARKPQLCFTSPDELVDSQGRPDFLWDMETSLSDFRDALAGSPWDRA